MKEWKFRQEIYHRLNPEPVDLIANQEIDYMSDTSDAALIHQVVRYFRHVPPRIIYPAKSYFVALVYARLIRDHFGEDFLEVLNDPHLLHGNDLHFKPYSEHQAVYDAVLGQVGMEFDLGAGEVPDVRRYFDEEFMIQGDSHAS